MTNDTRYRDCLREIRAVLERYDMAGDIHIVSQERSAFLTHFPTWSIVQFEQDIGKVRIKTTHLKDKDEKHRAVELSCHIVYQLRDLAAQSFGNMDKIVGVLETHFEVEHKGFRNFDPETGL